MRPFVFEEAVEVCGQEVDEVAFLDFVDGVGVDLVVEVFAADTVVLFGLICGHIIALDDGRGEFAVVPSFFGDVADGAGSFDGYAEFVGCGADVLAGDAFALGKFCGGVPTLDFRMVFFLEEEVDG